VDCVVERVGACVVEVEDGIIPGGMLSGLLLVLEL
jgi:hypothetical protein